MDKSEVLHSLYYIVDNSVLRNMVIHDSTPETAKMKSRGKRSDARFWAGLVLLAAALMLAVPAALTAFDADTDPSAEPVYADVGAAGSGVNEAKIGDTEYATLTEAIEKAKPGETVTLHKDITLDKRIVIDKNITLHGQPDKGHHKITITGVPEMTYGDDHQAANERAILFRCGGTVEYLNIDAPNIKYPPVLQKQQRTQRCHNLRRQHPPRQRSGHRTERLLQC